MTQWLRSARALTLVEAKLLLRQPTVVFFTLAFPVLLLVFFGALFGQREIGGGLHYIDFYLPALIGAFIGQAGLVGLPVFLAGYRKGGVLKRFQASPVSLFTYLSIHTVVQFVMLLVSALLMIAAAELVFGITFLGHAALVMLAFLVSVVSFFAAGFALSSLVPTAEAALAVGNFLFLLMFFLSGAAIPREAFPSWLVYVSNAFPLTHSVEAISGLWLGEPLQARWVSLAVLVGLAVASFAVARRTFRWQP